MEILRSHPLLTLAVGVAIGLMFAQQLKRIPGVSKLPSV